MGTLGKKEIAAAFVLVGLLAWPQARVILGAASPYDWCSNVCGESADCDDECEADGGGTTTCGEYNGGASSGWCDGDTCEDTCGPVSSPSWSCYAQGNLTDCYGYGDYASCGDDVCATVTGVESCGSCETDCGECRDIECGNSDCEDGESYRTCPADCEEPGNESCPDGICNGSETVTSCEDCRDPEEYCDGINHFCPVAYQCQSNWCSTENVSVRQSCPNGQSDCPIGYNCEDGWDVMTNTAGRWCFLDRN